MTGLFIINGNVPCLIVLLHHLLFKLSVFVESNLAVSSTTGDALYHQFSLLPVS